MKSSQLLSFAVAVLVVICAPHLTTSQKTPAPSPSPAPVPVLPNTGKGINYIPGRYIAVLKDGVSVAGVDMTVAEAVNAGSISIRSTFNELRAFSFEVSPKISAAEQQALIEKIKSRPDVAAVTQAREVYAFGNPVPLQPGQTPPTGVRRIGGVNASTAAPASTVSVAVLDTGAWLTHPDLNVTSGYNCITKDSTPANDGHSHGTHCAGIIGAKNDNSGVVGVAPGTRVVAVKVLSDQGEGGDDDVACGINWVADNAARLNIKVISMSLGGPASGLNGTTCTTTTDIMRRAVCRAVAAGVTVVVAAGNDGQNYLSVPSSSGASYPSSPAQFPEVLTVTAMADSDGKAGGTGPQLPCWAGTDDDSPASFSNYAPTTDGTAVAHTIAGPGVCINSTVLNNGYAVYSGTSMATPYVAGVVALCYGNGGVPGPCASKTPAQVIQYMRTAAQQHTVLNQSPATITTTAGSCLLNTTGLRQIINTYGDDKFTNITVPFPFTYLGKNYGNNANGGVFIGSNMYITFGNGSAAYENLNASNPALPSVHVGSGDNSWKEVWAGAAAGGCFRTHVKGCSGWANCNISDVIWEMTFCPDNTMSLCMGTNSRYGSVAIATNGLGWSLGYNLQANTRSVFRGFNSSSIVGSISEGFVGDPSRPIAGKYYGYMAWAGDFLTNNAFPTPSPSPQPQGLAITRTASSTCLLGITGTTVLSNTTADDAGIAVNVPFPFTVKGVNYGSNSNGGVIISSNGYITFGGNGTLNSNLGPSNPTRSTVFIAATDSGMRTVYGQSTTNSYRIRFEGYSSWTVPGATNVVWEATFNRDNSLRICVGTVHAAANSAKALSGVSDGAGRWLGSSPFLLQLNSLYTITGIATAASTPAAGR